MRKVSGTSKRNEKDTVTDTATLQYVQGVIASQNSKKTIQDSENITEYLADKKELQGEIDNLKKQLQEMKQQLKEEKLTNAKIKQKTFQADSDDAPVLATAIQNLIVDSLDKNTVLQTQLETTNRKNLELISENYELAQKNALLEYEKAKLTKNLKNLFSNFTQLGALALKQSAHLETSAALSNKLGEQNRILQEKLTENKTSQNKLGQLEVKVIGLISSLRNFDIGMTDPSQVKDNESKSVSNNKAEENKKSSNFSIQNK